MRKQNIDYPLLTSIPDESTSIFISSLERDVKNERVKDWLSARHNVGGVLAFNSNTGGWEKLYLIKKGDNEYTIKNRNEYMNKNETKVNQLNIDDSMTFIIEKNIPQNTFSLKKKDTDVYLLANMTTISLGTKTNGELLHHWSFYNTNP